MTVGNLLCGLILFLHTFGKHKAVSQLVMKLDKVGETSVDQTLIKVPIRRADTGGLTRVPCFYQFFKIHRSNLLLIDFVGQKYKEFQIYANF